jgi:hypothetical protein
MATPRLGGVGVNLPTNPGLVTNTTGANAGTTQGYTNTVSLGAGEIFNIPAGTFMVYAGPYTFLQWKDPVTGVYYNRPTSATGTQLIDSDGANFRLANTTGCVIGAVITTATCTGATNGIGAAVNGVSCTPSSGASVWQTIVGGAISATIATATTTAGTSVGSGYLYPPVIVIDAPPTGGLQATAIVTSLSTGTVLSTAIQVINQGAGYTTAPNLTFLNDPRDTAGSGAVYVTTLTATGQLTGLYPTNHGTALTAVPTLSFSIGSCQATALMNFTVTAFTSGVTLGADVGAATVTSIGNIGTAQSSPAVVNPLHTTGLTFPRPARINALITTGTVVATGSTIEDAGLGIQVVPNGVLAYTFTSTTGVVPDITAALSVGGITDTSFLQPV